MTLEIGSGEIESGVRQLLAHAGDCVWRKDLDAYGECWASDGEWKLLGLTASGREAIKAMWWQQMAPFDNVWHVAHNLNLAVEGNEAFSRLYLEETLQSTGGGVTISRGIYHDRYKREDGRWVFARRHFDLTYIGPADMSGRFFPTIDYGSGPADPDPTRAATPSVAEVFG
ncbi:MAG: hypothetical protein JWL66_2580 [Sphingomonadales bacterium]|nr:hypothetical protein [Sphingomonadales bacterium]